MLLMPARCTSEAICLQAVAMEDKTTTISESMLPAISCFNRYEMKVMPSVMVAGLPAAAPLAGAAAAARTLQPRRAPKRAAVCIGRAQYARRLECCGRFSTCNYTSALLFLSEAVSYLAAETLHRRPPVGKPPGH